MLPIVLPSPDQWPFINRREELWAAEDFLRPDHWNAPSRHLVISGRRGMGKSFFFAELVGRYAARNPRALCLYVNITTSALEGSQVEGRFATTLLSPRTFGRSDPQQVPQEVAKSARRRLVPTGLRIGFETIKIFSQVSPGVRDVAKAVPSIGPFVGPDFSVAGRLWQFVIAESRHRPVILAFDNVQNKEDWTEIALQLAPARSALRLITIESRQKDTTAEEIILPLFMDRTESIKLNRLPDLEAKAFVRSLLKNADVDKASHTAHRWVIKAAGNPKELEGMLQEYARAKTSADDLADGLYEERIARLPGIDKTVLWLVAILPTRLHRDDLIAILDELLHPSKEAGDALDDLIKCNYLTINEETGIVDTQHDIVRCSTSIQNLDQELDLRPALLRALGLRLDAPRIGDPRYFMLADNLTALLTPAELDCNPVYCDRLNSIIERLYETESYRYLASLYDERIGRAGVRHLSRTCQYAFLDAFQKTSRFAAGLRAIRDMRQVAIASERRLAIFEAKYLVQKFDYREAQELLEPIPPAPDRDIVLFNIYLNLCHDDVARKMIEQLPEQLDQLTEEQAVMLRNSAHLYNVDIARDHVSRALHWFEKHGQRFGTATARNNLGVIELWARNISEADAYLQQARYELGVLGSNEVYQPQTNLAVLHALSGDLDTAQLLLAAAAEHVSPDLKMDLIMLRVNNLVIDLLAGRTDPAAAAAAAVTMWQDSIKTRDIRFQEHIAWLATQLLALAGNAERVSLASDFDKRFRIGTSCSTEVFFDAYVGQKPVELLFQLSTHWRY